jgi:hypothetical protein
VGERGPHHDAQLRVDIQRLIVRIITSGSSRERMSAMLLDVHRGEKWPAIQKELRGLEAGGGGVL